MNFRTKTTILTLALFTLFLLSSAFFFSYLTFNKELQRTKQEIAGIYEIEKKQNLLSQIQHMRASTQIDINKVDENIKNDIFQELSILKNEIINNELITVKNSDIKSYSFSEIFDSYTNIIEELHFLNLETSDTAGLFFESERDLYFLIIIAFIEIPEATEEIAHVKGIGSGFLAKNREVSLYELRKHIDYYLRNISQIKKYIKKVSLAEARKIEHQIDTINTHLYYVNSIVKDIEKSTIQPEEFFSQTSFILKNLNNIFALSADVLRNKLQAREEQLENTLTLDLIIYFSILVALVLGLSIFYKRQEFHQENQTKKRKKEKFINQLRDSLENAQNLKDICNISLVNMVKLLDSVNGSLYLHDKRSSKLYLGAVYAMNKKDLKPTLNIHDNIISENVLDNKISIQHIEKCINLGNVDIECNQLVTVPLLDFEDNIGSMQLTLANQSKKIDQELILEIATFMATYIHKAQLDNETNTYLELIDANILMSKTDIRGNIKEVSQQLCTLSQYTKEELLGENHRILRHPDTPVELFEDLWDTITQGKVWTGELKNKKKDGGYYWIKSLITPDYDLNQNIIGYTAIRTDITDRKHIEEIAITDGLTNLYNRRHFDTIFPRRLEMAQRTKTLLTFVLIDIDNFKIYNDTYGHQDGDTTLQQVASTLKKTMNRPNDHAFRLGGEEFGLLYFVESEADAFAIADKARKNVEALQIKHVGNTASEYVTISSGYYVAKDWEKRKTVEEIYKLCDDRLYRAKKSGKNKVASS